jgi:hypothetical protein
MIMPIKGDIYIGQKFDFSFTWIRESNFAWTERFWTIDDYQYDDFEFMLTFVPQLF